MGLPKVVNGCQLKRVEKNAKRIIHEQGENRRVQTTPKGEKWRRETEGRRRKKTCPMGRGHKCSMRVGKTKILKTRERKEKTRGERRNQHHCWGKPDESKLRGTT